MEFRSLSEFKLLNGRLAPTEKLRRNQAEDTLSHLNQNVINHQDLEIKTSAILSRTNISPEIEHDFRRTCALFENQRSDSNSQLNEAYQKYISAYHKITSLYILHWDYRQSTFLHVFDTEKESATVNKWQNQKILSNATCLAALPNCELFFFGEWNNPGITFILNRDFDIRMLPRGEPCSKSSAIYLNRNVYCFGGARSSFALDLSSKYDLDTNRWIKLSPMPINDYWCSAVIFNDNILISGYFSRDLLLYSIDIDSFSTIPYNFESYTKKLLINAERLYLIECKANGWIYENEAGDEYAWKQIAISIINMPFQVYGLYNKGKIYIISGENAEVQFYKFDLDKKEILKL